MSLLDAASKKAKSILHTAEDAASSVAHQIGSAASALATEVADDVATIASKATSELKSAFNSVTTAVSDEVTSLSNSYAVQEVKTVAASLGLMSSAIDATSTPDNLVQAGENHWVTKDNKYSIQKVDKLDHQTETDALWAKFDADINGSPPKRGEAPDRNAGTGVQLLNDRDSRSNKDACPVGEKKGDPAYLDFTNLLACVDKTQKSAKPTDQASDKHGLEYIDASGHHVQVEVKPGEASYKAFAGNDLITSAIQTADHAMLFHAGETFNLDIKGQKLEMTNDQLKILQTKDFADIKLKSGQTIKRQGDKIELRDSSGNLVEEIKADSITFGGVKVFQTKEDMDKATRDRVGKATGLEMSVAKDGTARAIAADGSVMDMRKDGSVMIHAQDGHVFVIGTDKTLYVESDGKFIPITEWRGDGKNHVDGDGNIRSDVFNYVNGVLRFAEAHVDLQRQLVRYRDTMQRDVKIKLTHEDPGSQPAKAGQTPPERTGGQNPPEQTGGQPPAGAGVSVEVQGVGMLVGTAAQQAVTTTLASGEVFTATMGQQPSLANKYVTVKLDEIDVQDPDDPDRGPTIIKANNDVFTDGGRGPTLFGDGSMRLDERTSFGADGTVRSGDWVYSRDPSYYSFQSLDDRERMPRANDPMMISPVALSAQSVSASAQGAASEVYSKASSGIVTMADIGKLNSSIADISMLLNQLGGNASPAAGELQAMLGLLSQTLDFAAPKAAAAQIAIDRGERSPFIIKAIEDQTEGRTPDQAALRVLAKVS